jgi:ABC-type phosphate/phosphonate transport system substrate-binding protein
MTAGPLASFGMYDLPWLRLATDRLWAAIRDRMRAGAPGAGGPEEMPETLERELPLDTIWRDPALILAQACGWPLVTTLRDAVQMVATPCYDLPGCDGPLYCSFVVVQANDPARSIADLRSSVAAINGWDSQSGMNALRAMVAPVAGGKSFFSEVRVSGAHRRSLAMVSDGDADIAAIDCVTHGLLAIHDPGHLSGTRVLCRTPMVPGLPLVTAAATSAATLARLIGVLSAAMTDPALAGTCATLRLRGIVPLTIADYAPILAQRAQAEALGYLDLH